VARAHWRCGGSAHLSRMARSPIAAAPWPLPRGRSHLATPTWPLPIGHSRCMAQDTFAPGLIPDPDHFQPNYTPSPSRNATTALLDGTAPPPPNLRCAVDTAWPASAAWIAYRQHAMQQCGAEHAASVYPMPRSMPSMQRHKLCSLQRNTCLTPCRMRCARAGLCLCPRVPRVPVL
jgi:hypothetical protein